MFGGAGVSVRGHGREGLQESPQSPPSAATWVSPPIASVMSCWMATASPVKVSAVRSVKSPVSLDGVSNGAGPREHGLQIVRHERLVAHASVFGLVVGCVDADNGLDVAHLEDGLGQGGGGVMTVVSDTPCTTCSSEAKGIVIPADVSCMNSGYTLGLRSPTLSVAT